MGIEQRNVGGWLGDVFGAKEIANNNKLYVKIFKIFEKAKISENE
jgi:hypothetical protein